MKKLLLFSLSTIFISGAALAQPVCKVVSPASIAGNKAFTWAEQASSWSSLDLSAPGNFVQDTLMLVEDGSPGTNPQGNPISQEGCNTLINDLTGKIAVVYRNTCGFGVKAEMAQLAGAVGVVIVNREPGLINMSGGTEGLNVTIPVAFIDDADGAAIISEMSNGPVVLFLGNKLGVFTNDLTLKFTNLLRPKSGAVVADLAQNASEFSFDTGVRLYNSGSADVPAGYTVNAKVSNPSNTVVYDETVTGTAPLLSMDSIDIDPVSSLSFPLFSLSSYPQGVYTLTYTVVNGPSLADDDADDNVYSTTFLVTDSLFTYASVNPITNLPNKPQGYRPGTPDFTYGACIFFQDPNASRIGIDGVYWSITSSAADSIDITGEEINLNVFSWEDPFTNLNDATISFNSLVPLMTAQYYYTADLQDSNIYQNFSNPVLLTDNAKYLICAQTVNESLFIGADANSNYEYNQNYYLMPVSLTEVGGNYNAFGFGGDAINSVGAKIFPASELSIDKVGELFANVYPNPSSDKINIRLNVTGSASVVATDITGKVVLNQTLNMANGFSTLNIADLANGAYVLSITAENGTSTKANIIKK